MLKILKNLISPKESELVITDPDFGEITFYDANSWQMNTTWNIPEKKANICCIDIPGDVNGPSSTAREFLLGKKRNIDNLWETHQQTLTETLKKHDLYPADDNPKSVLHIESLAGESDKDWEVSFQADTDSDEGWIHISIVIKHGKQNVVVTK